MSGHSKWSQIKHKKGITDQKKGQLFSKLSKKISIAAKSGPDPSTNYRLQTAVEEARAVNMPKDNIERAIKKSSDKNAAELRELFIQGIGPASIAVVVEAITDNTNRTINEVRGIFIKNNIRVADAGSLDWMFDKRGIIKAITALKDKTTAPEEKGEVSLLDENIELQLIEAGAEDIKRDETEFSIICLPENIQNIKSALAELGFSTEYAQIELVAKNKIAINDKDKLNLEKLFEELDMHDDVESVYSNIE